MKTIKQIKEEIFNLVKEYQKRIELISENYVTINENGEVIFKENPDDEFENGAIQEEYILLKTIVEDLVKILN